MLDIVRECLNDNKRKNTCIVPKYSIRAHSHLIIRMHFINSNTLLCLFHNVNRVISLSLSLSCTFHSLHKQVLCCHEGVVLHPLRQLSERRPRTFNHRSEIVRTLRMLRTDPWLPLLGHRCEATSKKSLRWFTRVCKVLFAVRFALVFLKELYPTRITDFCFFYSASTAPLAHERTHARKHTHTHTHARLFIRGCRVSKVRLRSS